MPLDLEDLPTGDIAADDKAIPGVPTEVPLVELRGLRAQRRGYKGHNAYENIALAREIQKQVQTPVIYYADPKDDFHIQPDGVNATSVWSHIYGLHNRRVEDFPDYRIDASLEPALVEAFQRGTNAEETYLRMTNTWGFRAYKAPTFFEGHNAVLQAQGSGVDLGGFDMIRRNMKIRAENAARQPTTRQYPVREARQHMAASDNVPNFSVVQVAP